MNYREKMRSFTFRKRKYLQVVNCVYCVYTCHDFEISSEPKLKSDYVHPACKYIIELRKTNLKIKQESEGSFVPHPLKRYGVITKKRHLDEDFMCANGTKMTSVDKFLEKLIKQPTSWQPVSRIKLRHYVIIDVAL